MQSYDAIIVGGGPAGSSCAQRLVAAGLDVCVLDREEFPRQKLCAGWITPQVLQDLQLDPQDYPHRFLTFEGITAHLNRLRLKLRTPQHSIRRFEFDDYLLQRSGARVEQHLVREIRRTDTEFVVDDAYRCRYLIGAGGTRCPVYRTLFRTHMPRRKDLQVTTLEQEFAYNWADTQGVDGCHLWFFQHGLPGYAWYVPKAEGYLNCGLGAVSQALKTSSTDIHDQWKYFDEDLHKQGYLNNYQIKPKGYSYFLKQSRNIVQLGHAYLVGDAIGLATRDMGEGIGPAIASGQRAAEAILSGKHYAVDDLPALSLPDLAGYGPLISAGLTRLLNSKLGIGEHAKGKGSPASRSEGLTEAASQSTAAAERQAPPHHKPKGQSMQSQSNGSAQRDIESEVTQNGRRGLEAEIRLSPDRSGRLRDISTVPVTFLDRWVGAVIKHYIGPIDVSLKLWDGTLLNPEVEQPIGVLHILDRKTLWHLVTSPEIGFAESYTRGSLVVEGDYFDVFQNLADANRRVMPAKSWRRYLIQWVNRPRPNSLKRSKDNIHAHYDLGNEFYASWLDKQLLYTCAYYRSPESTLEQAQIDKMDHICRKLELKPGQSVLETGCGWGALSLHMAQNYGVTVRAYNISHEQISFARKRAQRAGLEDRIDFVEDDYRNATGKFDAFVSVGMLEHVGLRHYRELGNCIDATLKPEGRGLIHSIGRNWSEPNNPWIEKHIFPGSRPPSLAEMMKIFEPRGFSVLDVENLRLHYAKTCQDWLQRYEAVTADVEKQFGEQFVRAWRLYLTGSTVAFLSGTLQLFQVVFTRAGNNAIPWTRDYLYQPQQKIERTGLVKQN